MIYSTCGYRQGLDSLAKHEKKGKIATVNEFFESEKFSANAFF